MTYQEELTKKLENFPDFRERRFRSKYLSILALRKCGLEQRFNDSGRLSLDEMADFAKIFDSYRHEYDAVQKERKDLRGKDYDDGNELAQAKQIEFGYQPNYYQDVKLINRICPS